ncbi:hypothetical protein ACOCJ4_12930 [Knoellia sp. CPCC 206435]|uniref:hypothetical protein n=1 Tax=Knoellia terrae TaxID=3404797 RepID=UPI003B42C789
MRTSVPGDPASLAAAGGTARRVSRDLVALHGRGTTAYGSLGEVWGTSTSVRTRKQGRRAMDAVTEVGRHADVVGEALQAYAAELSELQARARAVLDAAAATGLVVEEGRVREQWGVTGEADHRTVSERDARARALQAELDAVAVQHRRRRDRLLAGLARSRQELEDVAAALRLG